MLHIVTERIYRLNSNEFSSTQSTVWRVLHSHRSPPASPLRFSSPTSPCLINLRHVSSNHLHLFLILSTSRMAFCYIISKPLLLAGLAARSRALQPALTFVFFRPKITTVPLELNMRSSSHMSLRVSKGRGVPNWVIFCCYLGEGK